MTRGHRGSLLLRCRALSSPSPRRFIPAHLQFPPPPSERSEPTYAGRSFGAAIQALHPFRGLRRDNRGSAPPRSRPRAGALTTRQASLHATDRSVAPPRGAFDAGLRSGPFPDRAASLLPGLLAATRTGLAPAGDDELMLDQVISNQPPPTLDAHRYAPGAVTCALAGRVIGSAQKQYSRRSVLEARIA